MIFPMVQCFHQGEVVRQKKEVQGLKAYRLLGITVRGAMGSATVHFESWTGTKLSLVLERDDLSFLGYKAGQVAEDMRRTASRIGERRVYIGEDLFP